jgi:Tol biopolymer transport system component
MLAFESYSTNLSPDNLNGGYGIYVRNLDTGAVAFAAGQDPALSETGRYLAFQSDEVYVRDFQTGTETLVSRADGPNGTPTNQTSGFMYPSITADGTRVAFETTSALDPADTDSMPDIYVRDLPTETTILVSRATGVAGAKANDWSERPSISSDGRFVAFESEGYNLDPNDTDNDRDIFVRDIQAHTTALASPATPQNSRTLYPDISSDGRFVAYEILANNGGSSSINLRDRQAGVTHQINSGSGIFMPEYPVMSSDARYIAFQTAYPLDPDDTDGGGSTHLADVYVRDMQTAATILATRGTGATGPDGTGGNPAISGDGGFVAFGSGRSLDPDDHDDVPDIYVRDMQNHITSLESRATPGYARYVRPRGATPVRLSLVPAYSQCTSPNSTHGAPLSFPSCSPPVGPSSLNLGVGDGSPALARSIGSVHMKVIGSDFFPADDADVEIRFSLTNVMRADLADYPGELQGRIAVRLTDKTNGASGPEEGTVSDFDLAFTVPCTPTDSTLTGSACTLSTTANSVLPGFAAEGGRGVYGLDKFRVYDGGPDEDADTTGGNSLLAVQGLFVP